MGWQKNLKNENNHEKKKPIKLQDPLYLILILIVKHSNEDNVELNSSSFEHGLDLLI